MIVRRVLVLVQFLTSSIFLNFIWRGKLTLARIVTLLLFNRYYITIHAPDPPQWLSLTFSIEDTLCGLWVLSKRVVRVWKVVGASDGLGVFPAAVWTNSMPRYLFNPARKNGAHTLTKQEWKSHYQECTQRKVTYATKPVISLTASMRKPVFRLPQSSHHFFFNL